MAYAAVDLVAAEYQQLSESKAEVSKLQLVAPSRTVVMLGAILITLQVLDGVLTALGMSTFGMSAEGNLLLRVLMEQVGYVTALVIAKSFAVVIVCILCLLSHRISWIKAAFSVIIGVYLIAAVVPWSIVLCKGYL